MSYLAFNITLLKGYAICFAAIIRESYKSNICVNNIENINYELFSIYLTYLFYMSSIILGW